MHVDVELLISAVAIGLIQVEAEKEQSAGADAFHSVIVVPIKQTPPPSPLRYSQSVKPRNHKEKAQPVTRGWAVPMTEIK